MLLNYLTAMHRDNIFSVTDALHLCITFFEPKHFAHKLLNMRYITVLISATLSLASTCHAWTQAADGTWVANNVRHWIGNGE
jgi:hypothetical protein